MKLTKKRGTTRNKKLFFTAKNGPFRNVNTKFGEVAALQPCELTGKGKQNGEDEEEEEDMAEDEYEVEKILKRRMNEKGVIFLYVKWRGWDSKWNTWEPEESMEEVEHYEVFLKNFEEKRYLVSKRELFLTYLLFSHLIKL